MKYAYFPGCSLKGGGRAYEESLLQIMEVLGIELVELDDWNCCGATAYMSVDEVKACALAARNLALGEKTGLKQMMAPCSACYLILNKTKHYLQDYPHIKNLTLRALNTIGMSLKGEIEVRHPLDVLTHDVGVEAIRAKVTRPLKGLKVVPYYGCQIVRPYATFDDQANPKSMDQIIEALGAKVIDWPLKTKCCGGSLTGTVPEAGIRLTYILLKEAIKRGADLIVTVCPLCQFNLDAYHDKIAKLWEPVPIPTIYFTQLIGVAFGMSVEKMGLYRNIIRARVLEDIAVK